MIVDHWRRFMAFKCKAEAITLALIGLAVIFLLISGLVELRDRRLIREHVAAQERQTAENTLAAERDANAKAADRQATNQETRDALAHAQASAESQNPNAAASPAGPVVNAVADELRHRRSTQSP